MAKKRIAGFKVMCLAINDSEMEIPEYINEGEELQFIRDNLSECNVHNLDWIDDINPEDAVTEEDIRYIYALDE